ncbi:MAG: hypothetical protein H6733_00545 [Alphaproteobacteria bacterium]|nr:hypothetical protein [Alphaproteobacteria bacterium]
MRSTLPSTSQPSRIVLSALLAGWAAGCGYEATIHSVGNGDDTDPSAPDAPDDTQPPIAVCQARPSPARPGDLVTLVGENSYDPDNIPLINYRWQLLVKPDTSDARLPVGQANLTGFEPDVVGAYTATLVVTNDRGTASQVCDTSFQMVPDDAIYVEMHTQYADDDMVLMLVRGQDWSDSWITQGNDNLCDAVDCSLDWGAPGDVTDDPIVLAEDNDGGPEVIAIEDPASGVYTVRVFDRPDARFLSDHEVEIVVYVQGQEAWRGTHTFTLEGGQQAYARIAWPQGAVTGM